MKKPLQINSLQGFSLWVVAELVAIHAQPAYIPSWFQLLPAHPHKRQAGQKSLGTGYKRLAILRAVALLNSLRMPNKDLPTKYELDASRGIFKADGPEDHARLLEAIEALKTMQSGLPLATPAVAPIAAPAPLAAPADDPTALRLDELAEKYFLLKK